MPALKLKLVGLAAATRFAMPYLRSSADGEAKAIVKATLDRLWAAAGSGGATEDEGTDVAALDALVVDDDDIDGARSVQFYTNDVADVLAYLCTFSDAPEDRDNIGHCFARIHESLDLYADEADAAKTGAGGAERMLSDELNRRRHDIAMLAAASLSPGLVAELKAAAERDSMDYLLSLYD